MKIAFDIGGVLSKYPDVFRSLAWRLHNSGAEVYVITDMHVKDEVLQTLRDNCFDFVPEANVHCADYAGLGEFCKAILLKKLGIDLFIDDFPGYVQWDSTLGPAPVRLLVAPDGFRSYWHPDWKVSDGHDFGRRVTSVDAIRQAVEGKA